MTKTLELVPLKCLRCGTLVPAEEEEVAWVCAQCGQGMHLTLDGLAPLDVKWAMARENTSRIQWLPFWVFSGTVVFGQRQSYGGQTKPDALWDKPCRFYVPAFPASLEKIETLGADLTRKQVLLNAGPAASALTQCTLFPADARHAVEFIVLTIEADRKDKLRSVDFTLDLAEPELWLLPFVDEKLAIE
jgi:hypothetical protein